MREKNINYKWIINTTGSNTYGTTFTADMTELLKDRGFEKLFEGNPQFGTVIDYTENEVKNICIEIMNMRKNYGQNMYKIEAAYFKVDTGKEIEFSDDDREEYRKKYFENKQPLNDEDAIELYRD